MKTTYTISFYDEEEIVGINFPDEFENLEEVKKWVDNEKLPYSVLHISEWDDEENCNPLGNLDSILYEKGLLNE